MARRIWTAGHSNLPADALVTLLQSCGVEAVADVRRFPASRRHPQFNRADMEGYLARTGLRYLHLRGLGGMREPRTGSANTGWRESAFRGYADHMETPDFAEAFASLTRFAERQPTCVLCAERDWHDCHRGLLADRLKVDGWEVLHIRAPGETEAHPYTAPARIVAGRLSYAADEGPQSRLDFD